MSEATPEVPATPEPTPVEPVATKSFTQDDVNACSPSRSAKQFGDYGDLKAKAAKLAELEESQRSRRRRRSPPAAATAERERDEARAQSLRYDAAKHGISKDYFDLLGSGDEDDHRRPR
jgi:hypothetical protein